MIVQERTVPMFDKMIKLATRVLKCPPTKVRRMPTRRTPTQTMPSRITATWEGLTLAQVKAISAKESVLKDANVYLLTLAERYDIFSDVDPEQTFRAHLSYFSN